jgi:hypothetical protein
VKEKPTEITLLYHEKRLKSGCCGRLGMVGMEWDDGGHTDAQET